MVTVQSRAGSAAAPETHATQAATTTTERHPGIDSESLTRPQSIELQTTLARAGFPTLTPPQSLRGTAFSRAGVAIRPPGSGARPAAALLWRPNGRLCGLPCACGRLPGSGRT